MTSRNIRDRLGSMLNPPEITTPERELEESREVAPGAQISGHLLAHHLEIPEGMSPDWSPLINEMRTELAEGVAEVLAELIGQYRPEPLVQFGQAAADAAGNVELRLPPVPLATLWEITNLYILHAEAASENFTVALEPGGRIGALAVPNAVGGSLPWSGPIYVRESVRLLIEHDLAALTAGARVEVAVLGRMHSTRDK